MLNAKRSFRLPAVHFTCALAFYICNLIIYWTKWDTIWRMLITIAIGYVFLCIYRFMQNDAKKSLDINNGYWLLPYFMGLGIISYLGAFGGQNIIKFGWDFLVIAIFSIAIFYWAIKSRRKEILDANLILNGNTS